MDNQYFAHYLAAFKPYANFKGRATRPQFWYFVLFNVIISIVLGFIDSAIFGEGRSVFGSIYSLVTLIPSLALTTRRLHDIGKSGWWQLMGIFGAVSLYGGILMFVLGIRNIWGISGGVGLIFSIWIIVLLATDTVAGKNQYDIEPTTPAETPTNPAA